MKETQEFKSIFRIADDRSKVASFRKANGWWNGRVQFQNVLSTKESHMLFVRCKSIPRLADKRCVVKDLRGRGGKGHNWVEHLHRILLFESERLSFSDVQLSRSLIKYVAFIWFEEESSAYNSSDVDPTTGRQIAKNIPMKLVDFFKSL